MHKQLWSLVSFGLVLLLAALSCNLPSSTLPPISSPIVAPSATKTVSQAVGSQPVVATGSPASLTVTPSITLQAISTLTRAPAISATPQNPLVTVDSLCWGGPGKAYEVISTIRAGTRVILLGRGILDGWWVVRNPTYHDPCWLPTSDVQIDPAMDLTGLHTYNVPPTPTP